MRDGRIVQIQSFRRFGFDTHLARFDPQQLSNPLLYLPAVGPDLRLGENQSRINICDRIYRATNLFEGFLHKDDRICPFPFRVRRREVAADITRGHRAQQRVGQRMEQDVAIRVAGEAFMVRKLHPAYSEGNTFLEFVGIPAEANSHSSPLINTDDTDLNGFKRLSPGLQYSVLAIIIEQYSAYLRSWAKI